jgi:hypothetical protein
VLVPQDNMEKITVIFKNKNFFLKKKKTRVTF